MGSGAPRIQTSVHMLSCTWRWRGSPLRKSQIKPFYKMSFLNAWEVCLLPVKITACYCFVHSETLWESTDNYLVGLELTCQSCK